MGHYEAYSQSEETSKVDVNVEGLPDSLTHISPFSDVDSIKQLDSFEEKYGQTFSKDELKFQALQFLSTNDSLKNSQAYRKIDSLRNLKAYRSADSLYKKTEVFYKSLQGVELTDEEIKNRTSTFLSNNDTLINFVSNSLTTEKQQNFIDEKKNKYEKMNKGLVTLKSLNSETAIDSLSKIKDSRKFRETLRREGIDMGVVDRRTRFIGKAKKKFDDLTFVNSAEQIGANNVTNWPLNPDYYKSRLFGYYDYYTDSAQSIVDSVQYQMHPPRLNASVLERGSKDQMDSIKNLVADKAWLKINKSSLDEGIDEVKLRQKEFSVNKPDYFEVIIGISNNDPDRIVFTPSLAYEIVKNLDFGLGIEATLNIKSFENTVLGYKGLLRYKPEKSFIYGQAESVSYIPSLSFTGENQSNNSEYQHSLNVGIGMLYGLGESLSLNSMVMYRVEKSEYSLNNSPFIFRLGINLQ